jgi:hypothetical protein
LAASLRQCVEPRLPVVARHAPLCGNPASMKETHEGRVHGSFIQFSGRRR